MNSGYMNTHIAIRRVLPCLMGLATALCLMTSCSKGELSTNAKKAQDRPAKVEIRQTDGKFQMFVNNKPFYVKGAGLEFGSQEKLAASGGNAFRTWRTDNGRESGQQILDRARDNGLYVAMGLEVGRERHGFNYDDPAAVAHQLESLRAEVIKYKDHPALLTWIIGNELNLHSTNPRVWDAVNDISRMIHQLDTNHPTMTALSGISRDLVDHINSRAPDLDLIGIQSYADIVNLPRHLKESGWDRSYLVTEWGATGHWEVGRTTWGAPIENDSTMKADFYMKRFQTAIHADQAQCLGSFVFLWGQKQERTPTWYGMFLETGEKTETVDVMHFLWNNQWPENRSPKIEAARLDGRTADESVRLQAGKPYTAKLIASDPDNDPLTYSWEVLEESRDLKDGGDAESKPNSLPELITLSAKPETTITAPKISGAYRLFGYVFDGKGGAAHLNIPFFVDAESHVAGTKSAN